MSSLKKTLVNQNGGSKTDTAIKLILVFFVSLLSFSVGTFVGKQFSDSQHRLAALEKDYQSEKETQREIASVPGALEVEPKKVLSQEDIAKIAEEFVQEKTDMLEETSRNVANVPDSIAQDVSKVEAAKNTEKINPPVKVETEATVTAFKKTESSAGSKKVEPISAQQAAQKIANGEAPVKPVAKPETPKKINLPELSSTNSAGKFTIQVSSHPAENDAKKQAEELVAKGYNAFYIPAQIDGKTWYRVSIGNFTTPDNAKEYLSKIKSNNLFKDAIVRKVVQ